MNRREKLRDYYQQMVKDRREVDPDFTYVLQGAAMAIALTLTVWGLTELFIYWMK